jgi:hypothetical protein
MEVVYLVVVVFGSYGRWRRDPGGVGGVILAAVEALAATMKVLNVHLCSLVD